jgi:hypothetical protein
MTTTTHTTSLDPGALRAAVEARDAATLAGLYADDATVEIVDAANTPSRPRTLKGRAEIDAFLGDVYARDMTHDVDLVVHAGDALGYSVRCTYPDGTRVLCNSVAQLRDGRIAREVVVQAWDA